MSICSFLPLEKDSVTYTYLYGGVKVRCRVLARPLSASIHNLRFIIRLTEQARQAILDSTFKEFKEFFLNSYYKNK